MKFLEWARVNKLNEINDEINGLRQKMAQISKDTYGKSGDQSWSARWPEFKKHSDDHRTALKNHFDLQSSFEMPPALKYWHVDQVIEALEVSQSTRAELGRLMPNAYDKPQPGEDDWPEADSNPEFSVANVWNKLSDAAKKDILIAFHQDHHHS